MKFIKTLVAVFCLVVFSSLHLAGAQEETGIKDGIYTAEVGNVSFTTTAERSYKVDFSISNNGAVQTGVKYRVALRPIEPEDGTAGLPFYVTYPEVLSLGAGDILERTVDFKVPDYLSGDYIVAVELGGDHGIKFAVGLAEESLNFVPAERDFGIYPTTCALYVVGEETVYELTQGVDVAATEQLEMRCDAFNKTGAAIELTPEFTTYERNEWGSALDVEYVDVSSVQLANEIETSVVVPLPLVAIPQAYDIKTTLSVGTSVLPPVVAHYVIQGESVTIHNVVLDKEAYVLGEVAKVGLAWTGSADNFRDNRAGKTSEEGGLVARVQFKTLTGQMCSEVVSEQLPADDRGVAEITVPVTADCSAVAAHVSISNAEGKTLTEKIYNFASIGPVVEQTIEDSEAVVPSETSYKMFIAAGATIAFLLFTLILLRFRKTSGPAVMSLILIAAIGFSAAVVYAGTKNSSTYMWWVEGQSWSLHTATVVFGGPQNKAYSGNSTISFTGDMVNTSCANTNGNSDFVLSLSGPSPKSASVAGNKLFSKTYWAKDLKNGDYTGTITWNDSRCKTIVGNVKTPGNTQDGFQCTVSPKVSETFTFSVDNPPVGSISVDTADCPIAAGASSCTSNVTWSIINADYPASTNMRNVTTSYVHSWNAAGTLSVTIPYGAVYTFAARDKNTNLDTVNVTSHCVTGTTWAGGICTPIPVITLTATPPKVGPGNPSVLTWATDYATACTASSSNGNHWSGTKLVDSPVGGEEVTPSITTVYTLTCTGPGGTASKNATVTMPSGSITAGTCPIPPESASCFAPVSWTANDFIGTARAYEISTPGTFITSTPGTLAVSLANLTVRLDDTGSDFAVTTTASPYCDFGGVWVPSLARCAALPIITIDADPDVIRSGETAELGITIDSPYDLNCTLAGGITHPFEHRPSSPIPPALPSPIQSYTASTNPLTAAQIVRITCVAAIAADLSNFAETRVNVVPVVQEI